MITAGAGTGSGSERALCVAAGLAGLAGVALSAVAAHITGSGSLEVAARFLLAHAPAFLGVAAGLRVGLLRRSLGLAAGVALLVGLVLFCGDLSWRALVGPPLLPSVAPTGGVLLMAGWALVALAAIAAPR